MSEASKHNSDGISNKCKSIFNIFKCKSKSMSYYFKMNTIICKYICLLILVVNFPFFVELKILIR